MNIIAYLSLLLTTFLSGIFMIIFLMPLSIFQFLGLDKAMVSYLSALVGSFALIWCYVLFFNWLGVSISIWIYVIMIILTIRNSVLRIRKSPKPTYEKITFAMLISGFTIGAILLIFPFGSNNDSTTRKDVIVNQIQLMEESRQFNNYALEAMDKLAEINKPNQSAFEMTEEAMASIAQFYKKALKEAEKVDVDILNSINDDYGKMYTDKYIKSLKLRIKGLNPEEFGEGSLVEGQILYNEFVKWEINMQNEMRKKNENKNSKNNSI